MLIQWNNPSFVNNFINLVQDNIQFKFLYIKMHIFLDLCLLFREHFQSIGAVRVCLWSFHLSIHPFAMEPTSVSSLLISFHIYFIGETPLSHLSGAVGKQLRNLCLLRARGDFLKGEFLLVALAQLTGACLLSCEWERRAISLITRLAATGLERRNNMQPPTSAW